MTHYSLWNGVSCNCRNSGELIRNDILNAHTPPTKHILNRNPSTPTRFQNIRAHFRTTTSTPLYYYPFPHIQEEAELLFSKSVCNKINDASLQSIDSSLSQTDALSLAVTHNHIKLTTRWRPCCNWMTARLHWIQISSHFLYLPQLRGPNGCRVLF